MLIYESNGLSNVDLLVYHLLHIFACLTDIPMTSTTPNGNTCLHAATARDQVSTSMLLCEHGADIYKKNLHGDTPLDVALECSSFTCERKLR